VVKEHPLVFAFDEAVSDLRLAWNRFNNCPPHEAETAVLDLKIAENRVNQIIKQAKEKGIKSTTINSRLERYIRIPFWLKFFIFRNPSD